LGKSGGFRSYFRPGKELQRKYDEKARIEGRLKKMPQAPKVVGANVLRRARMEDAYAQAETGVRGMMVMSATAQWHEEQTAKSLSKSVIRQREQQE
jgi:hypothetical protein